MDKTEHLLTCLIEECAEVQKAAAKALRFGLDDHHPNDPLGTNAKDIAHECVDLIAVYEMLTEEGVISALNVAELKQKKKDKVLKYLEYAKKRGTVYEKLHD